MVAWLGPAISAIGSIAGGIMGQSSADDAQDFARQQFRFQQKAAKRGITWRVKDAINAGIHPLYALGANTFSPSPISISGGSPLAEGVAAMGQDIGRAADVGLSSGQRAAQNVATQLALQKAGLENELLSVQIAGLRKANMATLVPGQGDLPSQQDMVIGGVRITGNPDWSPANTIQQNWGEPAEYPYFLPKALADVYHTFRGRLGKLGDRYWLPGSVAR